MPPTTLLVQATFPSSKQAKQLAKRLVKHSLATHARVIPRVTCFYRQQEKVQSRKEYLLQAQTFPQNYPALKEKVNQWYPQENHHFWSQEIIS